MVRLLISEAFSGVPRILPSNKASRAGLQPKVRPSGNSPLISHVATSPKPVIFGRKGIISSPTPMVRFWVGYVIVNGRSNRSSSASQMPSASVSTGVLASSKLSVPHAVSSTSVHPSLSSSISSVSGGVLVEFPNSSSGNPSPSVSA